MFLQNSPENIVGVSFYLFSDQIGGVLYVTDKEVFWIKFLSEKFLDEVRETRNASKFATRILYVNFVPIKGNNNMTG